MVQLDIEIVIKFICIDWADGNVENEIGSRETC